jgi:mRNA interferase MazF
MGTALKGTVHGRTVELDHQVERLEGQRVLVVLEPLEELYARGHGSLAGLGRPGPRRSHRRRRRADVSMIQRGDIRWFRFSTPDKRRPVLVLGRPEILPSLSQVPVIPLSTQVRGLRWEVSLGTADGLPSACVLKPEWIRIVERAWLGPLVARFPEARWGEVRSALLDILGL